MSAVPTIEKTPPPTASREPAGDYVPFAGARRRRLSGVAVLLASVALPAAILVAGRTSTPTSVAADPLGSGNVGAAAAAAAPTFEVLEVQVTQEPTTAAPTTAAPTTAAPTTAAPTTKKPTTTTAKPVVPVAKAQAAPAPTPAPATTAAPVAAPAGGGATAAEAAFLACVRQRESGGNYAVVSANGLYYGAYQYLRSTWDGAARIAGRGDLVGQAPNTVAPGDQDAVTLAYYRVAGAAPWGGICR